MTRVAIMTGSELRHTFFSKATALATGIEVVTTMCEETGGLLQARVDAASQGAALMQSHLDARAASERDFFQPFVTITPDRSNPIMIGRGEINDTGRLKAILEAEPDLLVSFGCSIVKSSLLGSYAGRFINVHLGLSPYYRGSGTNFWPLVNNEPEFVGATFMHIDAEVDTGEIIHQIRAEVEAGDTPHQIGNRLIGKMAIACADLIRRFGRLERLAPPRRPAMARCYRQKDFTAAAVERLYRNFSDGLVRKYLEQRSSRVASAPIVQQPSLRPGEAMPIR